MTRNTVINVDEESGEIDTRGGFDGGPSRKLPGAKAFILLMCCVGLAVIGWIIYRQLHQHPSKAAAADAKPQQLKNSLPTYTFATTPTLPAVAASSKPPAATVPALRPMPIAPPRPQLQSGEKQPLTPAQAALQRRLAGFGNGVGNGSAASAAGGSAAAGGGQKGSSSSSAFASRLGAAHHSRAYATMLLHPALTVPEGTLIPCGTTTELNSTQPGMVACQVSRDVYGATGAVRLIDKGTQVVGEVTSALAQGQNRVFVLWTRMRTPQNVIIHLDSPGTGALGSPGVSGTVDTHFWARFGGAMLVSVMADAGQAAIQAAANAGQSGNTTVNLGNTQATGNEMASEVLRATIDIPPTLYAPQGKAVSIFVARDLDLSKVYRLTYGR